MVLQRCGLEHLFDHLDERESWDRVLSIGEQQRLALARLLLHKPDWVFMDEATSALDDNLQKSLMGLFKDELAGTTLVSIAHRAGMDAYHDCTLTLVTAIGGARLVTKRQTPPARQQKPPRDRTLWRGVCAAPIIFSAIAGSVAQSCSSGIPVCADQISPSGLSITRCVSPAARASITATRPRCTAASGRPDVSTASLRITLVCAMQHTRLLGYRGDLPLYLGLQRYEAAHPRSQGFQHVPPAPDAKRPARVVVHDRLSWR